MKLLTQEEGAQLKPGDVVDVYWFTPRKTKGEERPSRWYGEREEWIESVDRGRVVSKAAWESTNDGFVVALEGSPLAIYCVNRMEKQ